MLTQARWRADNDGVRVRWDPASLDELPYRAGAMDLVTSSFGLIFAPRPRSCAHRGPSGARSRWRAGRLGGDADRLHGHDVCRMGEVLDAAEGMAAPFRWGNPDVTAGWLQIAAFELSALRLIPCSGGSSPGPR